MTMKAFLARLKRTRVKWHVEGGTRDDRAFIRCERGRCPIEAVAGKPEGYFGDGAKLLGLSPRQMNTIMDAADKRGNYSQRLRTQLLAATKLTERV